MHQWRCFVSSFAWYIFNPDPKTLTASNLAVSCATPVVCHLREIPECAPLLSGWHARKYFIAQLNTCIRNVFTMSWMWNKKMKFIGVDDLNSCILPRYQQRQSDWLILWLFIKSDWLILWRKMSTKSRVKMFFTFKFKRERGKKCKVSKWYAEVNQVYLPYTWWAGL